ncbi:uncharacterized protein G2W53_041300 [Senna tora]|uniref:Uncharacterized protein n=1 Tax=Senna tora TaxID=362788 RepID=A0A834W2S1_9FABA|nr:uncharacterized protein G2W53_041300 [Senna tora]
MERLSHLQKVRHTEPGSMAKRKKKKNS